MPGPATRGLASRPIKDGNGGSGFAEHIHKQGQLFLVRETGNGHRDRRVAGCERGRAVGRVPYRHARHVEHLRECRSIGERSVRRTRRHLGSGCAPPTEAMGSSSKLSNWCWPISSGPDSRRRQPDSSSTTLQLTCMKIIAVSVERESTNLRSLRRRARSIRLNATVGTAAARVAQLDRPRKAGERWRSPASDTVSVGSPRSSPPGQRRTM